MCLAIPGEVLSIDDSDPLIRNARVSFSGVVKEVSLAMVPEAAPGTYVLVHAGLAISVIDEDEAEQTLTYFREMEALNEDPPELETPS